MVAFDINIEQIEKTIVSINTNLDRFSENLQSLNNSLSNIDSCWQDGRTGAFISHVNKDNGMIATQMESLKQTVAISKDFVEGLKQYVKSSLNLTVIKTLKYNSDNVETAISCLNNASIQLDYAIDKLKQVSLTSAFVYYNKFNDIKNNISRLKTNIESLKTLLTSLNNNVKNTYQTMRDKSSKANPYIIGDKEMLFYKYRVETPNI